MNYVYYFFMSAMNSRRAFSSWWNSQFSFPLHPARTEFLHASGHSNGTRAKRQSKILRQIVFIYTIGVLTKIWYLHCRIETLQWWWIGDRRLVGDHVTKRTTNVILSWTLTSVFYLRYKCNLVRLHSPRKDLFWYSVGLYFRRELLCEAFCRLRFACARWKFFGHFIRVRQHAWLSKIERD